MARITPALIRELREAGLDVREVPGCWSGAESSELSGIDGLIVHATAGSRTATDQGELNVILNGSNTAPPPISQFMLGRTGIVYFVRSGKCFHVRNGFSGTRFEGVGNSRLLGIEGCNDNRGEDWSRSYGEYVTLVAVICQHYGWGPYDRVRGHKEHQPGDKSDPTFSMNDFRADVVRRMSELAAPAAPTTQEDDDVATVFAPGRGWAVVDAGTWRDVDDNDAALEESEQADANALAEIFGNFKVIRESAWDRGRAIYEKTGSIISPPASS